MMELAITMEIRSMNEREAEEVISWRYPGEYAFYDMEQDEEDTDELRTPRVREQRYFSALSDGELVGFFEFDAKDDVVEVGLGLRPDLVGQGKGAGFLEAGLTFARERFVAKTFRLRVAAFNRRAIEVYKRAGFVVDRMYVHDFYGTPYDFLEMSRPV